MVHADRSSASSLDTTGHRWPACANHTFKFQTNTWTAGPVSNTNGMLTGTITQEGQDGWACQRALTVANNVVVDVKSCGFHSDDSAVTVAQKMAAKVANL